MPTRLQQTRETPQTTPQETNNRVPGAGARHKAPEPLTAEQRRDLPEIVDDCYEKGSLLVTSQLPANRWRDLVGDPTLGDAILGYSDIPFEGQFWQRWVRNNDLFSLG